MATMRLQLQQLQKSYGNKRLFRDLTLAIGEQQHIAVIGRNGAGKSTLFKAIVGEESIESGSVHFYEDTRLAYLRQQDNVLPQEQTVIDYLLSHSDKPQWDCAKAAAQFEISQTDLEQPIGSFSGGYQMRIQLVSLLLTEPNLLLLDEPTNFLDLSTLLLLERCLKTFSGSFLVISHDREFLERTCEQTVEIAQGKAHFFPGPVSEYLKHKSLKRETTIRYNKKIAKEQRHLQAFVDRFRYKSSKASQAQSKLKQLNKLQTIDLDDPLHAATIMLPKIASKKGEALSIKDVSIGYKEKTVASHITFSVPRGEHIGIVGDNGQGKTTLLKTIAGAIDPLEGSIRFGRDISVGYYAQHLADMLDPQSTIEAYLQEKASHTISPEEVFRMAGNFLFHGDDLKKSISVLSGGEKARLCLAGLLLEPYELLLLDEPTNHLDVETVEALSTSLKHSQATIVFVSHDRTFVRTVADSIVEVHQGKVFRSHHDYDNYLYHLKETLHIPLADKVAKPKTSTQTTITDKEQRKLLYEQRKTCVKTIQDIEHGLMEKEKEEQELFSWFEAHPTEYSSKKQETLKAVQEEKSALEIQWVEAHEELQQIDTYLGKSNVS